jgi:hypothetical protein
MTILTESKNKGYFKNKFTDQAGASGITWNLHWEGVRFESPPRICDVDSYFDLKVGDREQRESEGFQSRRRATCGHGSCGNWNQESLCWRGPAAI